MQLYRHFAIAAALLLCSIATASAAGTGPFLVASDDFVLTGAQEQLLWQRIGRNASSTTPSGLIAAVGATLPASVALHALPATVSSTSLRNKVTTALRESAIAIWSVVLAKAGTRILETVAIGSRFRGNDSI